jgi:hypothetical protein
LQRAQARHVIVVLADDERASNQIAVAAEVLRRRVHHDVGAVGERSLEQRRRPRVVHHAARADVVRTRGQRGDVDHTQERVRRRLHPDDLRGGPEQALHAREVAHVARVDVQPPGREHLAREPEGAVVGIRRKQDVVAGGERLEDRIGGRHAGRERDRGGTSLERRERRLERLATGIRHPGVEKTLPVAAVGLALERGTEMDRRGHRARGGIDGMTSADGECLDAHARSGERAATW